MWLLFCACIDLLRGTGWSKWGLQRLGFNLWKLKKFLPPNSLNLNAFTFSGLKGFASNSFRWISYWILNLIFCFFKPNSLNLICCFFKPQFWIFYLSWMPILLNSNGCQFFKRGLPISHFLRIQKKFFSLFFNLLSVTFLIIIINSYHGDTMTIIFYLSLFL